MPCRRTICYTDSNAAQNLVSVLWQNISPGAMKNQRLEKFSQLASREETLDAFCHSNRLLQSSEVPAVGQVRQAAEVEAGMRPTVESVDVHREQ